MRYLLAAEADRIQHLLFRSSELREVVGGSQLLTRFCNDMPARLGRALGIDVEVITAAGGSFYLAFGSESDAKRFGSALAEAYYRATGGSLSVAAPPEPFDSYADYGPASEVVGARLREAKRTGPGIAPTHVPQIAFCESCGLGLAVAHEARFRSEDGQGDTPEGHYLCSSCRTKAAEWEQQRFREFLGPFYDVVVTPAIRDRMVWSKSAEDIGDYDPRNYVAYIVADGNGMGRVFEKCRDMTAVQRLSSELQTALSQALADPIKTLLDVQDTRQVIPALPLIMGGDDLFALVPAPWALDIAGRLCKAFQSHMTSVAQDLGVAHPITLTAAVVICKANYPYHLAHEVGEERLGEAKRVVKALAHEEGTYLSAVDVELIRGGEVEPVSRLGEVRPTLRPYWITSEDDEVPGGWGLPLREVLTWRQTLASVPSRRRSDLRALFDRLPALADGSAQAAWDKDIDRLLSRVERDAAGGLSSLRKALAALGGVHLDDWPEMDRKVDDTGWKGHGMGDLLRIWDWALDLDVRPLEYEGGEAWA